MTMSGFRNQVSDLTNQAIALLGGATAQSYDAVSLNISSPELELPGTDTNTSAAQLRDNNFKGDGEIISHGLDKLSVDGPAMLVANRLVLLNAQEETNEVPGAVLEPKVQSSEFLSRFADSSLEGDDSLSGAQAGFSSISLSADEFSEALATGGAGFSFLDFIGQTLSQAQASQREFEETFDGRRQGEFRELVVDIGTELGSGVREFSQGYVAGAGRDLLSSSIDATGLQTLDPITDPLLSVDYYAESAEVLNMLLDAVVPPIGSIVLPRLGPLVADPREELSAYAG